MATKRVSEKKLVVSSGTAKAPSSRKAAPLQRTTRSAEPVEAPSTVTAPRDAVSAQAVAAQAIAALAYSYWAGRGFQGGSPEEDWLRAERELRGSGRVATATA